MLNSLAIRLCGGAPLLICMLAVAAPATRPTTAPATQPAIYFNTNFQGGSLGTIEAAGRDTDGRDTYRLHVAGQYDQRGHNRQANWYFFRIDSARGREMTLTFVDLVGEYNDRPGALPYGPDIIPVFSTDRVHWTHFPPEQVKWDAENKEMTLRVSPKADAFWIAHIPPYVLTDLQALLELAEHSPVARVETIGKTCGGRDMPMVTITDFATEDANKKCIWLQARQHAWEAGTSWAMDGAIRFLLSDDPMAAALRKKTVFRFTPMIDLDGVATGKVRFNANGYDFNRHWTEVDLRNPQMLKLMPEIWYPKKAIAAAHAVGPKIDLMINLHNTETGEYLDTSVDDEQVFGRFQKVFDGLVDHTDFDPSKKLEKPRKGGVIRPPGDTTDSMWATHRVPVALMELRVGTVKKLGHRRTIEDWQRFGRELITEMAK